MQSARHACVHACTWSAATGPYAGILPIPEVVIDGAPRWKLLRKQRPLTAGASKEDGVQYRNAPASRSAVFGVTGVEIRPALCRTKNVACNPSLTRTHYSAGRIAALLSRPPRTLSARPESLPESVFAVLSQGPRAMPVCSEVPSDAAMAECPDAVSVGGSGSCVEIEEPWKSRSRPLE
jgi:hypothetical protein